MALMRSKPSNNVRMMLSLPVVALCFMALPDLTKGWPAFASREAAEPATAPPPVAFDTCVSDSITHDTLQFSSTTGAYSFTRCKDGLTLSGTGTIRKSASVIVLNDKKPDRLISASLLANQKTRNASLVRLFGPESFQTIITNQTSHSTACGCP